MSWPLNRYSRLIRCQVPAVPKSLGIAIMAQKPAELMVNRRMTCVGAIAALMQSVASTPKQQATNVLLMSAAANSASAA